MKNMGVNLSERLGNEEFAEWIRKRNGRFRFVVNQGHRAMDRGIENLDLSVRAYNCLKRAGYETLNDIIDDIEKRDDLHKIRNMGTKSADEVMLKIFLYNYENIEPEQRKSYISRIIEMN